jgi:hypothetical protein
LNLAENITRIFKGSGIVGMNLIRACRILPEFIVSGFIHFKQERLQV